jgi:flavodoxin
MKGKSLIVYYSWVGNTEVVAKEIQNQTGFDIQKIEEKKVRKLGSIMSAAIGAFIGFKSRLKPMDFLLADYENIFLGAQVWAGKTTPAINKYLSKTCFKNKKIWLFITKADEKEPKKVIDSITYRIEKTGGRVMGSVSLTTQWDPKTNIPITSQEVKDAINEWFKKIEDK